MFEKIMSFFNGIVDVFENLRSTEVNEKTIIEDNKNTETDSFPKVDVSDKKIPKTKKEYNDTKKRENER
ncbi:MAG: hypothetical protein IKN74_06870 [Clostridia bacterium]|nr:hypothetical protein [Clostridia bacterium]